MKRLWHTEEITRTLKLMVWMSFVLLICLSCGCIGVLGDQPSPKADLKATENLGVSATKKNGATEKIDTVIEKCQRKDSYYSQDACFFLRQHKATYDNAKAECISEGGELAMVNTEQHMNKIPELQNIFKHPYNVWIGVRYNMKRGQWISEATGAAAFGQGHFGVSIGRPENESCGAVLIGYGDRRLNAQECTSKFVFLCKERRGEATNFTTEENTATDAPGADLNTSENISSELTEKDNGTSPSPENGEMLESDTPSSENTVKVEASTPSSENTEKVEASTPSSENTEKVEASTPSSENTVKVEASTPSSENTVKVEASTPSSENTVKVEASTRSSENTVKVEASTPSSENTVKVEASTPNSENTEKVEASTPSSENTVKVEASTPSSENTVKVEASTPSSENTEKVDAQPKVCKHRVRRS